MSYRDKVWEAVVEEVGEFDNSKMITFGLVKWLSEEDCEELCRIYEIGDEEDA